MTRVRDLIKRLEQVKLREEVPKIIEKTSYEIIALNNLQLYSGLDSKGERLRGYRSAEYAQDKHEINPKPGLGTPDLFLTGSFYKGMGVVVNKTTYLVTSNDAKSDSLESKYGKEIFGLTDKNKAVYAKGVVFQGVKSYIEGKTGLKFR